MTSSILSSHGRNHQVTAGYDNSKNENLDIAHQTFFQFQLSLLRSNNIGTTELFPAPASS
jgi:hypothetical protein